MEDKFFIEFLSQDERLKKAIDEGKDTYAVLASILFGYKYEDCLEKKDGQFQKEASIRRQFAKSLILAQYFKDYSDLQNLDIFDLLKVLK